MEIKKLPARTGGMRTSMKINGQYKDAEAVTPEYECEPSEECEGAAPDATGDHVQSRATMAFLDNFRPNLERMGAVLDVKRRYAEDDAAYTRRLYARVQFPGTPGSLKNIDHTVSEFLAEALPVHVTIHDAKTELAIYWLRTWRPSGFFAKLAWTWRTVRSLWRAH